MEAAVFARAWAWFSTIMAYVLLVAIALLSTVDQVAAAKGVPASFVLLIVGRGMRLVLDARGL